jgi:glycosyltransferase involved in cell wall biosynthesis
MLPMTGSPKISIIISTYNGAKYIVETIASVRSQTYQNWELIIIDDGSDDNTGELVAGIADERIRFYKAGRIGVNGRIKNIGLSKASGELVAFIDHDDLWGPSKLEKQVKALQDYPNAGFSLTGGYHFKILAEPVNYFYKRREGIKYGRFFLSFFQAELAVWTQALLVRKECIDVAGKFSESSLFADPAFIVNLAYHFDAVMLYEPLAYHRLHTSNYSTINWVRCQDDGLNIILSYQKNGTLPPALARDALFRSYIDYGEKYFIRKQRGKAIRQFFQAWKNKPLSIIPAKKTLKALLFPVLK